MKGSQLSRKRYLLALAVVFTSVTFAGLLVLCVAIDRRYGSNLAIIEAIGAAILVAMWVAMFPRKPSQRAAYPRIEHLRIAGKDASTDAANIGVSPLHLR
jgi:hypothetical protein